jgi:hypothetical protein
LIYREREMGSRGRRGADGEGEQRGRIMGKWKAESEEEKEG